MCIRDSPFPYLPMLKFYQYPKCSTCKKAKAFLKANGITFQDINIKEKTPTIAELKLMLSTYNGELKKLFNTSGLIYRELGLKDKIADMKVSEALSLLKKNGMLIKRPFLLSKKVQLVGYKEKEWKEIFN